jgi:hypothetical protein
MRCIAQAGGYPVRMLNTQYRMHPAISTFPSARFYDGSLLDGPVGALLSGEVEGLGQVPNQWVCS